MAVASQAGEGDRTDIAESEDADLHRLLFLVRSGGGSAVERACRAREVCARLSARHRSTISSRRCIERFQA